MKETKRPPKGAEGVFDGICLFLSKAKKSRIILKKPLDKTVFVWYNSKLHYNRFNYGHFCLPKGTAVNAKRFSGTLFVHNDEIRKRAFHTTLTEAFAVPLGCPFDP